MLTYVLGCIARVFGMMLKIESTTKSRATSASGNTGSLGPERVASAKPSQAGRNTTRVVDSQEVAQAAAPEQTALTQLALALSMASGGIADFCILPPPPAKGAADATTGNQPPVEEGEPVERLSVEDLQRMAKDLGAAIEFKSPGTLGLIPARALRAGRPPVKVHNRRALVQTAMTELRRDSRNAAVYGALWQLLVYMMHCRFTVGVLTDGGIFVLLLLRRAGSFPGEAGNRQGWKLHWHVHEEGTRQPGDPSIVCLIAAALYLSSRARVFWSLDDAPASPAAHVVAAQQAPGHAAAGHAAAGAPVAPPGHDASGAAGTSGQQPSRAAFSQSFAVQPLADVHPVRFPAAGRLLIRCRIVTNSLQNRCRLF